MTTTKDIQKFYHKLMELKDGGYTIRIEEGTKNYTAYYISHINGNAKYEDCVIFYNGSSEDAYPENVCDPQNVPVDDLLKEVSGIVQKIEEIFK
jgi:hypothetical protein